MVRSTPGTVYLVGAGPGDPGLITVRGSRNDLAVAIRARKGPLIETLSLSGSFLRNPRISLAVRVWPSWCAVASGPYGDDYNWTEVMMKQAAKYMDAYSVHYYTIPTGVWKK